MQATRSLRPWFTHRKMFPKWIIAAAFWAVAILAWHAFVPWAILIGAALFFPAEYLIHRWVYHRYAVQPHGPRSARNHLQHHLDPGELDTVFNPPEFSVPLQFVLAGIAGIAARSVGVAAALGAGAMTAMLYYEYVHFTAHRPGVTPWMPWNRGLKKMHLWHHYKSEHYWFGVTTKWLDRLFRSYRDPESVEKSPTVRTLVPPEDL